jgi:hypothetical protein
MKSGDGRSSRGRLSANDPAQGALDGLLPTEESAETPRKRVRADRPVDEPAPKKRAASTRADASEPLGDSLDRLEENVTLLLARHGELIAARAEADARRREGRSLDPIVLRDRVVELEKERERLDRHAAFLEERIRGLLSRVRYVVES